MASNSQPQESSPLRRRRLKISYACQSCRARKVKCDGARPECGHCQKSFRLRGTCSYTSKPGEGPSQHPSQRPPEHHKVPPESPEQESRGDEVQEKYCSSTPGVFAGEIKAAIDARLGLPGGGKMSLIPMTDAPLFGLLPRPQVTDNNNHHVDHLLPTRKQADYLVDMYWRHIQPLEPFLDPERFPRSYQALFSGSPLHEDEGIFLSTLNTIFAFSTQLQEDMPYKQRNETSNTYFQRAWTLLRPEISIWEPGSLELVQCLLLMGRYLQCTSNAHQTWMAVGSAVRIAQSLRLHPLETSPPSPPPVGDAIERDILAPSTPKIKLNPYSTMPSIGASSNQSRHIWQCCVFMDRVTSWASGRMSMVPLTGTDSLNHHGQKEQSDDYFAKLLELYEISNHVMLSQTATASGFADKLGLPRLYQNDDYLSRAVKLDVSLHKWEKSLHRSLRLDESEGEAGDASHRQRVILRLRLLHARILLFRPMLARYCLSQPQTSTNSPPESSLSDRILHSSASLCLENAQQMITLITTYQAPSNTVGIIPWWNRILYLHVAGTTLIAATLRSDLFTPSISQSWNQVMQLLKEHAYLSPFVEQCVEMFENLSTRILETHHSNENRFSISTQEGALNMYFQDVFQDLAFDPIDFSFGREDINWLGGFGAGQGAV